MIDNRLCNFLFHGMRPLHRPPDRDGWRDHRQHCTTHNGSWRLPIKIDIHLSFQTQALERLLSVGAEFVIVRPLIYDEGVVVSDAGYVCRLIDDGNVALVRKDRALNLTRSEFARCHELILFGADIIIIVRPILNSAAAIKARFRWERSPADIVGAFAPRNPGRRPFVAGNPNPAYVAEAGPASVMIGGPTKRFLGNPRPTGVSVNPAPLGIRMPIAGRFCLARLPDVSVIRCLAPVAVRFELRVKRVVARPFIRWFARSADVPSHAWKRGWSVPGCFLFC